MELKGNNRDLTTARSNKADEFYTMLDDISVEMNQYKSELSGKKIHCPCDDAEVSQFVRFFNENIEKFGISQISSLSVETEDKKSVKSIRKSSDNSPEISENNIDSGSFDSETGKKMIEDADVIITNPPFSRFRDFISLLIKMNKKFIIMGNINAVTYREVFPYIVDKQIRLGDSIHSGDRKFYIPDDYPLDGTACGVDEDGNRYIRVKGIRWFTNLNYNHSGVKHTVLSLKYNPEIHQTYDTYPAINVNSMKEIPVDYYGEMGAPITVIDKMNAEGDLEFKDNDGNILKFELIGQLNSGNGKGKDFAKPIINGKCKFKRLIIKRK